MENYIGAFSMVTGNPFDCFVTKTRVKTCLAGLLLSCVFAVSLAQAHATVLWCYIENDTVFVEAFFMGGEKVQKGNIFVVDKAGNKVLEGITSKEGLFQFVPPVQDDMTIVLRIDNGHGADFILSKQDFLDAAEEKIKE